MTAISLGATRALQYSVVGQDASDNGDVKHVGILSNDEDLQRHQQVLVFEMVPPKHRVGTPNGRMLAHAVGYLNLAPEERRKFMHWLDDLKTRSVVCTYHVLPSRRDTIDSSGRGQYTEYSCAGFVATGYREGAGVSLVVEEGALPAVDRALTEQIWERPFMNYPKEQRDAKMKQYGLSGEGPWQVLLPGYLLHALNQARSALPYTPGQSDWKFP